MRSMIPRQRGGESFGEASVAEVYQELDRILGGWASSRALTEARAAAIRRSVFAADFPPSWSYSWWKSLFDESFAVLRQTPTTRPT